MFLYALNDLIIEPTITFSLSLEFVIVSTSNQVSQLSVYFARILGRDFIHSDTRFC